MSLMHRLTCGFEELSLSVLEMEGNVKGGDGGGRPHNSEKIICRTAQLATLQPVQSGEK